MQSRGARGLALDIDETLADSNSHWFDHMIAFHPLEGVHKKEIVERYKFMEHVPGWDNQEAIDRMTGLMHSNEFNETVPLIEDAYHVVNTIQQSIPIAAYITARPATIRTGTEKWLLKNGFPKAPLIMRPTTTEVSKPDGLYRNSWKANILQFLYPEVLGIVDDNLGLAHELVELKYPGTLYLYGPQTEAFTETENVILCPTWKSVLPAVLRSIH